MGTSQGTDWRELLPPELHGPFDRRGFTDLTPVQLAVLEARGQNKNLRISSQTGSGKTVALGIALAEDLVGVTGRPAGPLVLVLAPTRELAAQVAAELDWLFADVPAVRVAIVTGGTELGPERRALAAKPSVVVGTPGRTLDHLRSGALVTEAIRHVVLDEADHMFDLGFREDLEAIIERMPAEGGRHLVSATFPDQVRRFAQAFQGSALQIEGTRLGEANTAIAHVAYPVLRHERYAALVNLLLMAPQERCIIFVRQRAHATEIAERLTADGFLAASFSGDLAQAQRNRTLEAFRSGAIAILVATDVAARGIDVADIHTVIHLDVEVTEDVYTHRSGRTGRAGRTGRSVVIVPHDRQRRVAALLESAGIEASYEAIPTPSQVRKLHLKAMRRTLHERMASEEPIEENLAYADKLLAEREPREIIAHLLAVATPKLPCEPLEISPVTERRDAPPRTLRPRPRARRFRPARR